MKKILLKSMFALALIFGAVVPTANAQCTGGTAGAAITPTTAYQLVATNAGTYRTFNATAGLPYEFTYCAGGATPVGDMQITILDNAGVASPGGYNDDFCGLSSSVTWTCPTTGTYRVLISRFFCNNDGTAHGNMAYRVAPPANDLCSASTLVAMPSTTAGQTVTATAETPAPATCVTSLTAPGVWYRVVGNGNRFTASTCGLATWDSKISVFTGACGAWTCVTGNDDACGLQTTVNWCTTTGTTYFILVHGFGTATGTFSIALSQTTVGNVTVTPASAARCSAGPGVSITASGLTTYSWAPAAGLSATTGATVTATPAATTTYTVTGTDGATGCTKTSTVTITVNTTPTVTASSTAPAVCAGGMVTLTGGGASTYTWTGGATNAVAFAPAATATYTVTGTDGNGCTNTATSSVTVNALPTVTASSTASAVCAGGMVTLTGGGASTYTWTGGATNAVAFAPAATATYTVTGTDGNGCTNTATSSVTVNALPTVTANSTASAVCAGGMVTLTGGGATSYTWDNSVVNGVAFAPASTLTYNVTGTDGNGCVNTASTSVTVNALPTVTASSTASAVCAGGMVTLTGGGASTYTWTGGATNAVAFAPAATATYTVTGTDGNGCTNTATSSVTVNALPTVTASSTASAVCAGGMVTLTGGGAISYTWDNSVVDGVAFAPASTLTYNVTGTDGNGCMNTASTTVTVNALPTVTGSASSSTVCDGDMVTLTGGGATSYAWDNSVVDGVAFAATTATTTYNVTGTDVNGCTNTASVNLTVNALPTVIATASLSTICVGDSVNVTGGGAVSYVWDNSVVDGVMFAPTATTTYNVIGTDANGCMNTASTTIAVNSLPSVTASVDNDTVCAGTMITLTGGGAASYIWDNGATDAVAFASTVSTLYTVTGTDANGCINSDSIYVMVNALPSVTMSAFTAPVCLQLTSVALTGGSPAGGVYSGTGVTGTTFNPSTAGVGTFPITYTVTDANSCSNAASSSITVQDCTGIEENLSSSEVNVYPNPTMGMFNIAIANANIAELVITIVDIQGKEVFSSLDKNVNGAYNKQINVEELSKGLYYIKMNTGAEVKIQKLIIQ